MPDGSAHVTPHLPNKVGVGYKAQHLDDILQDAGHVAWLEIHAENYMGDGGAPIAQLKHLAERFPISCHGVGLSIGSETPLDQDHLHRLKKLMGWLNPASFSEHLAWSTHDTGFLNDLLPVPYDAATLTRVAEHIDQVQEAVGRKMLLENPSTYVQFAHSTMEETDFLREIVSRTGLWVYCSTSTMSSSLPPIRIITPKLIWTHFLSNMSGKFTLAATKKMKMSMAHRC